MKAKYRMTIKCYFVGSTNSTTHAAEMPLKDIEKWVEGYRFTHPTLDAISVKIYMPNEKRRCSE